LHGIRYLPHVDQFFPTSCKPYQHFRDYRHCFPIRQSLLTSNHQLPTHIHGDLDSINHSVRDFYNTRGVAITRDPDQYSTDFGKAMAKAAEALVTLGLGSEGRMRGGERDGDTRGDEFKKGRAIRDTTINGTDSLSKLDDYVGAFLGAGGSRQYDTDILSGEAKGAHAGTQVTATPPPTSTSAFQNTTNDIDLLVFGTLSGRIDHGIGLLHEMLREQRPSTSVLLSSLRRLHRNPQTSYPSPSTTTPENSRSDPKRPDPTLRLTLVSESSLSFLLPPRSTNTITHHSGYLAPIIGILPVYGPSRISTRGLFWDVQSWETRMGGMVSTSNQIGNGLGEFGNGEVREGGGDERTCTIVNEGLSAEGSAKDVDEDQGGNWLLFTVERQSKFPDETADSAAPEKKTSTGPGDSDWWGSVMGRWQGGGMGSEYKV